MSIFEYLDYRLGLLAILEKRKKDTPGFTQTRLADQSGIKNTYLTNVLKGRGNFSSDQIFALAKNLKLSRLETQFLFVLRELDQTVMPERRLLLQSELQALRQKAKKTEHRIATQVADDDPERVVRYYSDPQIKIVHILLQIPRFANNPALLGPTLGLQPDAVNRVLEVLIDLAIIRYETKSIQVLKKNYHLPKESPMLLAHQVLMRLKSAERLQVVSPEKRYSFSVTFSTSESTRAAIHEEFLQFLAKIESQVKSSVGENAYQINFDLFPWNNLD